MEIHDENDKGEVVSRLRPRSVYHCERQRKNESEMRLRQKKKGSA
jgi:hypothetical protein